MKQDKDSKEEFCAPCALAIPAALGAVGVGSSAAMGSKDTQQQTSNIIMWVSISVIILSAAIFLYLKLFKKDCNSCKAK